ncbi:hypothetical protein [Planctomycetes bacterium TBK1r]|uniref:Uncharacterized protein n=1 Tax=Stieleria magnilauensis TaxID=2527963 RepID=A0ABX5Y3R2_9BACT|nr:hypothetical protein TBK1r_75920 [Planctomycetes bacterium TBK1r]
MRLLLTIILAAAIGPAANAQFDCVRYIVPHNMIRVCSTFYTETCWTNQSGGVKTYQCGNPTTAAACAGKSWHYHGDDYNQEVKEQRDANTNEEGREPDEANPDTYQCGLEGDCECNEHETYFKCEGDILNPSFEDAVDWVELSGTQCFGW